MKSTRSGKELTILVRSTQNHTKGDSPELMPGHLIRLRGGWERLGPGGAVEATRVVLPLAAPFDAPGRLRLGRWFQAPPLEPDKETLWLRLDSVPGLVSVGFIGSVIARGPFQESPVILPLGGALPARNRVVLDAEFPEPAGFPWGDVGLLIRAEGR